MRQAYWFGGEFTAFSREIAGLGPCESYRPGQTLSVQGGTGGKVFYIEEGIVEVCNLSGSGRETVHAFHSRGSLCALDCLVAGEEAVVTIRAQGHVTARPVFLEDLFVLAAANPLFARRLMEHYCRVVRFMCFVAVQMGGTNALQRVAALLLMYAEQTAYLPEEPCLQLSQEQVASLVNLSRAQVARVYQRLRQENIIQSGRNYVIVKDPGRLEQYGGLL